ncbi:MAG: LON peptidase substrate-binding domain-containing protein [Ilumatobacteraceae bacterium]
MAVLPMFPLGSVLLPGAVLPLHVFEPRYRALVADCLESDEHEFGVLLIERGSEVGGGDHRTMVGTVARMMQVAELEDGRYAVICVGTRRIRVNAWLPDDPYPLADVDDWPDDEAQVSELADRIGVTTGRVRRACALANELGDSTADPSADISDDPVLATYHLAALAPIGPADAQAMLSAPGPLARLDLLDALLDDVEVILRFRLDDPESGLSIDEM